MRMPSTSFPLQSDAGVTQFTSLGVAKFSGILSADDLEAMDAWFPNLPQKTAGARNEAFTPETQGWLASNTLLSDLASRLLGFSPVHISRMLVFNKAPSANWFVPWHQDRAEDGVERPVETLERTVALRIHLDDCNQDNGPLEVLPGTHLHGRLDASAIKRQLEKTAPIPCLALKGEILAMRPLLVHRSQRAKQPSTRRVIHLEYCG